MPARDRFTKTAAGFGEGASFGSWPGNIRELQNVIERGVVPSKGTVLNLEVDLLPVEVSKENFEHGEARDRNRKSRSKKCSGSTFWTFLGKPAGSSADPEAPGPSWICTRMLCRAS